jgi:hypothetical protein
MALDHMHGRLAPYPSKSQATNGTKAAHIPTRPRAIPRGGGSRSDARRWTVRIPEIPGGTAQR